MDKQNALNFISKLWDDSIVPTLMEYIKIPNKSPHFDRDWQTNGYMDQAVYLIATWCKALEVTGMQLEVVKLPGRTPMITMEIPGNSDETILLYGHLDKQPEMLGWEHDLSPWKPVLRNNRLYGRGAADDGYAAFASLAAIKTLEEQDLPHARCIILIEACEESGSYDLPFYIDALQEKIGQPDLIICLDSGCGNYEQLWLTTSLRGLISGSLKIAILNEGIHSGAGSGIVPSSMRILRQLLNRIEDEKTGNILLNELHTTIPQERLVQAECAGKILGKNVFTHFPFLENVQPESDSINELILRNTWKPALSVIGCDGMPLIENAGNVTLPFLRTKLSMRLPPTVDATKAAMNLKTALEKNPPYYAKINFEISDVGSGWNAPSQEEWLTTATSSASQNFFGKDAAYLGEGGSIPFMGMLGKKFPAAQFMITGVLGPGANAHGPNEFLHIPTAKKLTACVAKVITAHFTRKK